MTDKKLTEPVGNPNRLTDKEIIKALECCSSQPQELCCNCPIDIRKIKGGCITALTTYAIDLITRLQAENKRLSTLAEFGNTRANDYRVMRDRALKAEAEVERLKNSFIDMERSCYNGRTNGVS